MSYPTLTVYGNSQGCSQLRLLDNKLPVDLEYATSMVLVLDDNSEISSLDYPDMFDWRSSLKGVLSLRLGLDKWWPTAIFYAKLIVYDPVQTSGIYWGTFRIRALENPQQ